MTTLPDLPLPIYSLLGAVLATLFLVGFGMWIVWLVTHGGEEDEDNYQSPQQRDNRKRLD